MWAAFWKNLNISLATWRENMDARINQANTVNQLENLCDHITNAINASAQNDDDNRQDTNLRQVIKDYVVKCNDINLYPSVGKLSNLLDQIDNNMREKQREKAFTYVQNLINKLQHPDEQYTPPSPRSPRPLILR